MHLPEYLLGVQETLRALLVDVFSTSLAKFRKHETGSQLARENNLPLAVTQRDLAILDAVAARLAFYQVEIDKLTLSVEVLQQAAAENENRTVRALQEVGPLSPTPDTYDSF